MSFFKASAVIVVLALVLQSGCDFWCYYGEELAAAAHDESTAALPCHGAAEDQDSQPLQHSDNRGIPKNCVHPQAADDGSKLQVKIVKANQTMTTTAVTPIDGRFRFHSLSPDLNVASSGKRSGTPPAVRRI